MSISLRGLFWAIALALAVTGGSGCDSATTISVSLDGDPVPGADVWANFTSIGVTDADGLLMVHPALAAGTVLVARKLIYERPGFRANHGPENEGLSWTQRVYLTNAEIRNDASVVSHVVDAAPRQDLVLSRDNVLEGLHVMVSLIWDASTAEMDDVGQRFRDGGAYLYNATDGQIFLEQVDVVDDNRFWNDAGYHWHADLQVWPTTSNLGGLLFPNIFGSNVEMSRRTDQDAIDPKTIIHEFGHFGLGMMDEYVATTGLRNWCTENVGSSDPDFGYQMPKASCVMDDQRRANKFCSDHGDNPHQHGLMQITSCWDNIEFNFNDFETPARWTLKSPESRGAILGTLPPLPTPWQARVNVDNHDGADLCPPITFTLRYPNGSAAQEYAIFLANGARHIAQGKTDTDGVITVVGAHLGDHIWTGLWRDVVADGAGCRAAGL